MIFFPLLSWFLLTAIFYKNNTIAISLIKSYLLYSLVQVISLEILSIWSGISFIFITIFWISFSAILIIYILLNNNLRIIINFIYDLKKKLKSIHPICYTVYIILFITNLLYPPNNFDSLAYRLGRIVHWIQNGNLNFYQTNSIREFSTPPLTEYKILHLYILTRGDRLISFVQYTAMILIIPTVTAILDFFIQPCQKKRILFLTIIIVPSIFMLTFQATTTQTDLLSACFAIMVLYWAIKPILTGELSIETIIFLCLAVSLTYFTKPNALIFLLPICVILGILYIRKFKWKVLYIIPIFLICFIVINGVFLFRIYSTFGNLLGEISEKNLNRELSFAGMISNVLKNISMHMTIPLRGEPEFVFRVIKKIHEILGIGLNNPEIDIWGEYWLDYHFNEDMVGNFFYLMIFMISFVLFCFETKKDKCHRHIGFLYIISLIIGYCIFSLIAPWQPWQPHLDLPCFVLTIPFVVYSLENCGCQIQINILEKKYMLSLLHFWIFIYIAILPILFNNPNKYPRALFVDTREVRYFASYPAIKNSYISVSKYIKDNKYKKIGLTFGWNDWEYPLWVLCDAWKNDIQFNYLGHDYPNKGYEKLSDADIWIGYCSPDPSAVLVEDFEYLKIWKSPD